MRNETGNAPLYLRFFDIVWDTGYKKPIMQSPVRFLAEESGGLAVVPVVYITNRSMLNTEPTLIDSLAIRCFRAIQAIAAAQGLQFHKLQIDCDWSDGSRENYFHFLRSIKVVSQLPVEATIRLHQVKYLERTGIPPVDRGLLMFYNMGKIQAGTSPNSIYNEADAEKYLSRLSQYPLPLDIALPVFSWVVRSRDGKVSGLLPEITATDLQDTTLFSQKRKLFTAKKSFFLKGIYFKPNDQCKLEGTDVPSLYKIAGQVADKLPADPDRTIIYYEISNIPPTFTSKSLLAVSARF